MLYCPEQLRGPIYAKEILHLRLLQHLSWQALVLFQNNFMAPVIPLLMVENAVML